MSVRIKPITDHKSYEINGHTISKDLQGNWIYKGKLSRKELYVFAKYTILVIQNPRFKTHTQAIYKG